MENSDERGERSEALEADELLPHLTLKPPAARQYYQSAVTAAVAS